MNRWNEIYQNQDEEYQYYDIYQPHEDLERVSSFFKRNGVDKVLDLGCGVGRNLIPLAKEGFDVSGIDLSPEGLRLASISLDKEGLKAELRGGNIFENLPYEDGCFNAVISIQVLQHGTVDEIKRGISEIERVLVSNGLTFITLCGRYSQGKLRYCLVKTARKTDNRTYVPTQGNEMGLPHFIYNKALIIDHYRNFGILEMWKDSLDYYCFIGRKKP